MATPEAEVTQRPEFCVIFGANEGAALPLAGGPLSLGREVENDIVLDGAAIAAHHATIELAGGRVLLETAYPVWMDSTPVQGKVEVGFDVPFRLGSCLCVVTTDARAWFERDVFDFVVRLFGHGAASALAAADEVSATGDPQEPSISGAEAASTDAAGLGVGVIDPSLRTMPEDRAVSFWQRVLGVFRPWRVYDRRRLRRAVVVAFVLALFAFPMMGWAAVDRANAWFLAGVQNLTTNSDLAADGAVSQVPVAEDSQQEELKALVSLVNSDGRVEIIRSSNGEFAVRGFVMSGNAYVRLLSGLSMLRFPVDMQVQNRGSQVKALELLVSHKKDANLEIVIDNQTGQISVSGNFPTQDHVDEFIQQVKLELPSIADLTLAVESTDTVAKKIAERVRRLGLGQVKVLRSATEIVVTGAADVSGMENLEVVITDVVTSVPVHNRVKLYREQDNLQLTAGDLDLVAIVMSARPVIVDRYGNRFQVGDVMKGGFRVIEINFNEVLVQQGTYLTAVALN